MRWQSVVRLAVAAVGVGVAGLVYVQLSDRPVDPAIDTAPLSDPNAVGESHNEVFEVLGPDGTPTLSIGSAVMREFADGRKEFDDVTATFTRAGVRNTMSAKSAIATGKAGPTGMQPREVLFRGSVRLSAEDGMTVEADDEATFYNNEQKTVIPGRMRFTRGRLSGSGVGAELHMDKSVLWINSEARLSVAPETEGGTPIDAQAGRIGLAEADHYMVLETDAVMTHQSQRLSASNARVSFTQVGDVVQFIELRGGSAVESTDPAGTRPNLTGENINLTFAPDTGLLTHARVSHDAVVELKGDGNGGTRRVTGSDIDMFVAPDGETLTKLQASDPVTVSLPAQDGQPATVIESAGLLAEGDDARGLTRAVFSGGVIHRETRPAGRGQPAATRVATSNMLVLGLKGDLGQVEAATFSRGFRVVDGDLTATASEGRYNSAGEILQLRSPAGATRPKVTKPDMEVVASEIDINLAADSFEARGEGPALVDSSLMSASAGTTRPSTGLFEAGKVVTGTSERLSYQRDQGRAVYEGTVFLVQGGSRLVANRVELDDAKSDLKATGKVRSTLVIDAAQEKGATPTSGKPQPTVVSSDQLVYTDAERTAVYTGTATITTGTGEQVKGDEITLTLEAAERALKSVVAVATAPGGIVRVTLLDQRSATGQRATYVASTDVYEVVGTPAVFVAPDTERGPGECSRVSGTLLRFERTKGASEVRTAGGALGTLQSVKCAEVIK